MAVIDIFVLGGGNWWSNRDEYVNISGVQRHVTQKGFDVLFFVVAVPAHGALSSWHLGYPDLGEAGFTLLNIYNAQSSSVVLYCA